MKNQTEEQLDQQILDHADEIIRLMKLKGMKDKSSFLNFDRISIWIKEDEIQVADDGQGIKTINRKKK